MTYRDTDVARISNREFKWEGDENDLKRTDVEFLTESLMDSDLFDWVCRRAAARDVPSRHLDWGSVAIPAAKAEILDRLSRWKVGRELPGPGDEENKPKQSRARSLERIRRLPETGAYVLVTEEY